MPTSELWPGRKVYADEHTVLVQGNAFEILHGSDLPVFDHLITDPPYGERTHEGARTGSAAKRLVTFPAWNIHTLEQFLRLAARHTRRWAVFTCDDVHASQLSINVDLLKVLGWRFVRKGVWVKPGAAPQFTGDRPGQGWEAVAILHRVDAPGYPSAERMRWNGGGKHAVFTRAVERGGHPTQKPVGLLSDFVRLFTDPGDAILDPLCGSGSTLVAAKYLRRRALGIDSDKTFLAHAKQRLEAGDARDLRKLADAAPGAAQQHAALTPRELKECLAGACSCLPGKI